MASLFENVIGVSEREYKRLVEDSSRLQIIKKYVQTASYINDDVLKIMLEVKEESEGDE